MKHSSLEDTSDSSDDDILDTQFSTIMSTWKDTSQENKNNNTENNEPESKKQKVKELEEVDTHFDTNKPEPKRSPVFDGHLIFNPLRYDKENEKLRLKQIVTNGCELVWADVHSLLQSKGRSYPLWWPGRILQDREINFLDTSTYKANQIRNRKFCFVELFGYRKDDLYYPVLIPRSHIQSIYKPHIDITGEEVFALDQYAKEKVLSNQWKDGMDIYYYIISEKKLEILKATPLEEFEKSLDTIETTSELKDLKKKAEDDSYKQLLAKYTVSSTEQKEKEKLYAGDLISYYYKPYGPVGDKKALFQTRVVAIKSVKGKLKLSLENGHSLVDDTQVRRVEDANLQPVVNDGYYGSYKCLEEYELMKGDVSKEVEKYQLYSFDQLKNDLNDVKMEYTKQLEKLEGQKRIETMFYDKEKKAEKNKNSQCTISNLLKEKNKIRLQQKQTENQDQTNQTNQMNHSDSIEEEPVVSSLPNPFESDIDSSNEDADD